MMNKACFVLLVAMAPASLFAGETMEIKTYHPPTTCDFRVDKCETTVATDPSYFRFKDGKPGAGPSEVGSITSDPGVYQSTFGFVDYASPQQHQTVDELVALIRKNLSNCPEVTVTYDCDSGDITVHYLHSTCQCDCDWVVNVRDVKADDFVLRRTTDNYSEYLGQMERRKFHCTSEESAQSIETACSKICTLEGWEMFK